MFITTTTKLCSTGFVYYYSVSDQPLKVRETRLLLNILGLFTRLAQVCKLIVNIIPSFFQILNKKKKENYPSSNYVNFI